MKNLDYWSLWRRFPSKKQQTCTHWCSKRCHQNYQHHDSQGSSTGDNFADLSEAKVNEIAAKVNMLEACGNTKIENNWCFEHGRTQSDEFANTKLFKEESRMNLEQSRPGFKNSNTINSIKDRNSTYSLHRPQIWIYWSWCYQIDRWICQYQTIQDEFRSTKTINYHWWKYVLIILPKPKSKKPDPWRPTSLIPKMEPSKMELQECQPRQLENHGQEEVQLYMIIVIDQWSKTAQNWSWRA